MNEGDVLSLMIVLWDISEALELVQRALAILTFVGALLAAFSAGNLLHRWVLGR